MTVCKDCKHCKHYFHDIQNHQAPEVWYNHFYTHPTVEREEVVDPVTGETGYKDKNDFGMVIILDQPYPNCREYNKSGTRSLFERNYLTGLKQ